MVWRHQQLSWMWGMWCLTSQDGVPSIAFHHLECGLHFFALKGAPGFVWCVMSSRNPGWPYFHSFPLSWFLVATNCQVLQFRYTLIAVWLRSDCCLITL